MGRGRLTRGPGRVPGDAAPYHPGTRLDPPLRAPEDAIALIAALEDGTIDAIASDHAPARAVDVQRPFGEAVAGMSSLETTLGLVLETVDSGRLSLVRAMRALSLGPWRALDGGRFDLPEPTLRVGSEANLVVFDRADRWIVADGTLRSRGRNTPLMGTRAARSGAADHRPRPAGLAGPRPRLTVQRQPGSR